MPRLDLAKARQTGMTDQQIQQYAQAKGITLYDSTPQQSQMQQPQQQDRPFSPLDLLPVAGGLIGGVGGGVIAGPFGAIGLGAVGSGAGEALRQRLTGENNPDQVLKESALGLIGGGAGEAIGGAARIGAKLIGKGAGKALTKAGEGAIASQYNVPRNVGRAINFPQAPIQLTKYGITSIDQVPKVADQVTGANGVLSQAVRKAVAKAGPVPLGAYTDETENLIPAVSDLAKNFVSHPSITVGAETKFNNFIHKAMQQLGKPIVGSSKPIIGKSGRGYGIGEIGTTKYRVFKENHVTNNLDLDANPSDVYGLIQDLEKQAAGITRGRAPTAITAEDQALSKAYYLVADELRDRLFSHAGADNAVLKGVLTPDMIKQLSEISPTLAQEAMAAQNVRALREIQKPFVNANQAYDETVAGSQFGLKSLGDTAKGAGRVLPSLGDPLAPLRAVASSDAVNAKVGGALIKAGQGQAPKGAGVVTRGVSQTIGQGGTQLLQSNADQTQNLTQGVVGAQGQGGLSGVDGQDNTGGSQVKDQQLRAAFAQAILKSPKQATAIKAAYDLISGGAGANKPEPVTEIQRKSLAKSGMQNLKIVDQELSKDKNVLTKQLLPGTYLSRRFDSALFRTVEALLRVRTGSAAPEQEVRRYMAQFGPKFGDSPSVAKEKLDLLKDEFDRILQERGTNSTQSTSDLTSLGL